MFVRSLKFVSMFDYIPHIFLYVYVLCSCMWLYNIHDLVPKASSCHMHDFEPDQEN